MADSFTLLQIALGDSISTAFNAEAPDDNLAYSWATGSATDGRLKSHWQRLQLALPHAKVEALNLAFHGARATDLSAQLQRLEGRRPDYVTLLIGANDLMQWLMLSDVNSVLLSFKANVERCLQLLIEKNPRVMIVLSSIPDQARVLELRLKQANLPDQFSRLLAAQPQMLEPLRRQYHNRWERANAALAAVASAHPAQVRFVAKTTKFLFEAEHLSALDSYHPSILGQQLLADLTWEQGWFP